MALKAAQCRNCGGTVAMKAGAAMPRCLFCDSDAVVDTGIEAIEQPGQWIPFAINGANASERFQDFAGSRWYYPSALKNAGAKLEPILVPAWVWSGRIETHYAALIPGNTRSGKQPHTGEDTLTCSDVLVLAGSQLTRAELNALAPYAFEDAAAFDAEEVDVPFELSLLTRSVALGEAKTALTGLHRTHIGRSFQHSVLKLSSLYHDLDGRPVLLPVYICSYRHKDTAYRLVINGQTGEYVGKGPTSIVKIVLAAIAALSFFAGIGALLQ